MLKTISLKTLLAAFAMTTSFAAIGEHQHHAKHNMLLYGSDEIFAYHIVYKVPHNYQVILRINFDTQVREAYLTSKENHPNDTFVLLLDSMDISKIAKSETLTGTLLRRDSSGQQVTIIADVTIEKENFKLLFFDELPLDLSGSQVPNENRETLKGRLSTNANGPTDHWNWAVVKGWKNGSSKSFHGGACDGETPNAVSIAFGECRKAGFSDCQLVNSGKSSTKCY